MMEVYHGVFVGNKDDCSSVPLPKQCLGMRSFGVAAAQRLICVR